jgi:hypothetical protein
MRKSTALVVLSVILLLTALTVGVNSVRISRSYLGCASRLMSEASPGDRVPPESFHRLSRALRVKTDLYLSRVLAQECKELGTAHRGFGRRLVALGTLKAQLPLDQRENLDAVLLPAHGGRGLTYSAQTEWGRPPEALNDAEMTWLFVVGQIPSCSRSGTVPERDRQACDYNYKLLLSKLRSP